MKRFLIFFSIIFFLSIFHIFIYSHFFLINNFVVPIIFTTNFIFLPRLLYKKNFYIPFITFVVDLISFVWISLNSFAPLVLLLGILLDHLLFERVQFFFLIFFLCSNIILLFSLFRLFRPRFFINRHEITVKKNLNHPCKIALISDLHLNALSTSFFIKKLVHNVNSLSPDYIFVLGDVFSIAPHKVGHLLTELKNLNAKYGIFVISGNADFTTGIEQIKKVYMTDLSWTYISNSMIRCSHFNLAIYGCEDPCYDMYFNEISSEIMSDCLSKTLNSKNVNILLFHRNISKFLDKFPLLDFQFSGHSHGAQFWPATFLNRLFNVSFLKGLFQLKSLQYLFVSQGCSYSSVPVHRLGTKTEIALITLLSD